MATKSARNLRSSKSLTSTRPTDGAGAAGGAGAALWTGAKPSTPCPSDAGVLDRWRLAMYPTTANSDSQAKRRSQKPPATDQHGPQRRKDHAPHTGAVECLGECHGTLGVKPGRNDGVDARRPQRNPTSAGEHGGTNSCHGCTAAAQPSTPTASNSAPATVLVATPIRRWMPGKQATTPAPHRK